MKILLILLTLLSSTLFAELKHTYLTQKVLDSGIPIVDIRTVAEWKHTGILKGSIPIQFFDERGKYSIAAFLKELNEKVDTKKPFALICRTGSRTRMVASFLSDTYKYDVTNITGGIMIHQMDYKKLPFIRYTK